MKYSHHARMLLAGAALMTLSAPALALDGNDVLAKISAAYNVQGGSLAASSVEVSGSTVTLEGVTFNPSSSAEQSFTLGRITLEGVEEEDDGGYFIETATFPDVNFTQDQITVTVSDLYMSGISVPADATTGTVDSILFYEEAHSGPVSVIADGKNVFSLRESIATMAFSDDESSIDFAVDINGVKADLSSIEDPKALQALTELGLLSLDGQITMKGSWVIEPGTIEVEEYAFDFTDVGRLNMAFSISGYTMQFVKSMQETLAAAEAGSNPEQAQQAAGLAMLGLIQQLTFNNAEISFEDDNLTGRALNFAGSQQGMSGEQMAQTVKALTPLMIAQLNLPDLQNAVSAAVNAFIDNPQNIRISASPASPVPFPMIIGAAMGAPNTLPQVLGVTVAANE